jgi:hypothetical protein
MAKHYAITKKQQNARRINRKLTDYIKEEKENEKR